MALTITITFTNFIILFATLLLLKILYFIYKEILFKTQKYLNKNKKILITGGCLGLGREIIHILITKFNCNVINLDVRENEFVKIKSRYKGKITNIYCNIAKINNITSFLKKNDINPDEIDIIINNGKINFIKKLHKRKTITS